MLLAEIIYMVAHKQSNI